MSITLYLIALVIAVILILLSLWWAVQTLRHALNMELRWHRDTLLAHMRLEEARRR